MNAHGIGSFASRVVLGAGLVIASLALVSNAGAQLEEIIITASKREATLQTSAISVSAISGEDLKERGAVNFFDFAPSIPNLSFGAATDGVLSGRSIAIRGIQGLNTTGVYVDDTPLAEDFDPRILGLERVEVLRGPQGTLYGARALGGTVRYITTKPDTTSNYGSFSADISTTKESSDSNRSLVGSANVRLSDQAALIVSGLYEYQEGVFDLAVGTIADHLRTPATFTGSGATYANKNVDDRETLAFSASLFLGAAPGLSVEPRVVYQKVELDGFPLADIGVNNFNQNRDFATAEGGDDEWTLLALTINYESAYGTFTSATSHFDRKVFETEASGSFINFLQALPGADGGFGLTPVVPVPSPIFQEQNFETTVQEFRFASDFPGLFNFVAGVFYQDTLDREAFIPRNFARGQVNGRMLSLGDNFDNAGVSWPFGDLVFTAERPTDIEEAGVFSEMAFDFGHAGFLLGVRWFDTSVEFSQRQAGLAARVPLADDEPLSSIDLVTVTQEENGFNLKGSVEFDINERLFAFASIAQGFRLGGANVPVPDTLGCPENLMDLGLSEAPPTYDSDNLLSYEAGIKADLSSTARVNLTAFLIEFDNIQQLVSLSCGFQFTGNLGAAESKGIELEARFQPSPNLQLGFDVGYTDAEFTKTVGGVGSAEVIVRKGDVLQFVPKWTASGFVGFVQPDIGGGLDLFVRADISLVDDSISRIGSERKRDSYKQVGLRFGLRNEKHKFTFYIRNLTDEIANLGQNRSLAAETPGRQRLVVTRPRTQGFEFSVNF